MSKYIPLHVHSMYSLLDSCSKPEHIVNRLDELELDGCAVTDHGTLSGCIKFLKQMKKKNKKPLLGIEFYICGKSPTIKDETNKKCHHALFIAKNTNGWTNLCKMISEANREDYFYYRPRLSWKEVEEFSKDIICINGHLGSTLSSFLLDKDDNIRNSGINGLVHIKHLKDIFHDNLYLEVQLTGNKILPHMNKLASVIREFAESKKIKCVATPDAHYCKRKDVEDQRVLLCKNLKITLDEGKDSFLKTFFLADDWHIPSYQEMLDYGNTEEELENTLEVAEKCSNYEILRQPMLPAFECDGNVDEHLKELCRDGWRKKIKGKIPKERWQKYGDRVKTELKVLQSVSFSGNSMSNYFLIVQDLINYVQKQGWLPGPARGSAAGCLVSYLLDITKVDPLKYNLLFERFYNAGRNTKDKVSLPDIDCDVPKYSRNKLIEYLKNKYGHENVVQIATFQALKGRAALKEVFRAHGGVDFASVNEMTMHIPDEAKITTQLKEMKDRTGQSSIIKWALENNEELQQYYDLYPGRFEQAIRMENTIVSKGKHAAGVLISPKPIAQVCGTSYDTKEKTQISQMDMGDCEDLGLVKLDILGLKTLDVVMRVQQLLRI